MASTDKVDSMTIESSIRTKITNEFKPEWLELENESSRHAVPAGSESHFRLVIVSTSFVGLSRVDRQRKVYDLLKDERAQGLHALALWTYTPEEWKKVEGSRDLSSPNCHSGAGKKQ